ncbi:Granulin [Liparis tanakae]|uniref:Granulin n=1 Tax=Liparis tanakae TaxID=230148 RepID=A0A4Z2HC28_9TELE|nr:Granulin [Liparis tanakae]
MLRVTLWLLVGGFASASHSIRCPDGTICPDSATCCLNVQGYSCCPYPQGVCCSDQAHCCPSEFHCNLVTQTCDKNPWLMIPMVKKQAAEEPSRPALPVSPLQKPVNNQVADQQKSSAVRCDSYYLCPDHTTCCRHPTGAWFCCLYPYTSMTALTEAREVINEDQPIRCDDQFFCRAGTTCCNGPKGQWSCCPFPLGQCCADGVHCCGYGYTCDPTSLTCKKRYSEIPSRAQEEAKTAL